MPIAQDPMARRLLADAALTWLRARSPNARREEREQIAQWLRAKPEHVSAMLTVVAATRERRRPPPTLYDQVRDHLQRRRSIYIWGLVAIAAICVSATLLFCAGCFEFRLSWS